MYRNKKILGIITARGGSKGIIRKNILKIGGKPLIAWTIEQASRSRYLDRLILSSEDSEIINVAKKTGCEVPFVRPEHLAKDETPGIVPVLHAIKTLPEKFDFVVLLQPTSPLRSVEDIDGCIEHCITGNHLSCVSVTEPDKSPFWMYRIGKNGYIRPLLKSKRLAGSRQKLPKIYVLNGAVYVAECKWLLRHKVFVADKTAVYKMPKDRSLDIDTEFDILKMNALLKLNAGK